MPLVANFSTSQTVGAPESINFVDTSTGSDGAISERRIYLAQADGTFLVPSGTTTDYIVWALADTTITIDDILPKDMGLNITVVWVNSGGTTLYDKFRLTGFTLFNETFDYNLTQQCSGNPLLINDNDFFENKSKLRTMIDSGNNAIEFASDIFGANQCYNIATELRLSSQYFFNTNA